MPAGRPAMPFVAKLQQARRFELLPAGCGLAAPAAPGVAAAFVGTTSAPRISACIGLHRPILRSFPYRNVNPRHAAHPGACGWVCLLHGHGLGVAPNAVTL